MKLDTIRSLLRAGGERVRQDFWTQLAKITADDVSDAVMNVVGKTAKLDGKSADLFQK